MNNEALKILASNPHLITQFLEILDKEISLPNIPTPTMGGHVFWNTLCEYNGWNLQQNMVTHHARILNDENVRIAWGTMNGMIRALNRFVELSNIQHSHF